MNNICRVLVLPRHDILCPYINVVSPLRFLCVLFHVLFFCFVFIFIILYRSRYVGACGGDVSRALRRNRESKIRLYS